jgi:hypothetical protein
MVQLRAMKFDLKSVPRTYWIIGGLSVLLLLIFMSEDDPPAIQGGGMAYPPSPSPCNTVSCAADTGGMRISGGMSHSLIPNL